MSHRGWERGVGSPQSPGPGCTGLPHHRRGSWAAPSTLYCALTTEHHALSTLLGCRVVMGVKGSTAVGVHQPSPSPSCWMVLGWGPGGAVPGQKGGTRASPSLACPAGPQRCSAASTRRHNSLPSRRSVLPKPDKVPQPERGRAPVWVWSPFGHCVKAGASAPSHGHHRAAVPGRAGALELCRLPMPCRAPTLAGRGEGGGLGSRGGHGPCLLTSRSHLPASVLPAHLALTGSPAPEGEDGPGSPHGQCYQCWHASLKMPV